MLVNSPPPSPLDRPLDPPSTQGSVHLCEVHGCAEVPRFEGPEAGRRGVGDLRVPVHSLTRQVATGGGGGGEEAQGLETSEQENDQRERERDGVKG